jgi:WD40 repeat protein
LRIFDNECSLYQDSAGKPIARIWQRDIFFSESSSTRKLCNSRSSNVEPVLWVESRGVAVYKFINGPLLYWKLSGLPLFSVADPMKVRIKVQQTHLALSSDNQPELYEVIRIDEKSVPVDKVRIVFRTFDGTSLLTLDKKDFWRYRAAISPDNNYLAIGAESGTITLWGIR